MPPQYIVVPPNDGEMKDMIGISQQISNNQNFKSDSLFEKCEYLLFAILKSKGASKRTLIINHRKNFTII
jgi:hypothetical protein